jgi:hypothetical protein
MRCIYHYIALSFDKVKQREDSPIDTFISNRNNQFKFTIAAKRRESMFCKHDVKWLFRLSNNFSWQSKLIIKQDYAFKDKNGSVRLILEQGGKISVTRGYAWNGCSPKFCCFDLLVGSPDGVVDDRTEKPKTYYASLVHDAMYQFLPDGIPVTRRDADRCFLMLMEETGFRPRLIYYLVVRILGGLVWRIERIARKTKGTAVQLPY